MSQKSKEENFLGENIFLTNEESSGFGCFAASLCQMVQHYLPNHWVLNINISLGSSMIYNHVTLICIK